MNRIYSNHLKVVTLLKSIEFQNKNIFLLNQNIELYIKEIYNLIFPNKKNKINIMIQELLSYNNLSLKLKKFQAISKEERHFFIILQLLIKKNINLETCAKKLLTTRRTLNYDLIKIKTMLLKFNLSIDSQIGKGIFLKGNDIDIKKASFYYFNKFLIEYKFLPVIFTNQFYKFFYGNEELSKSIDKLSMYCKFDFFNTQILLQSFYLSFRCSNSTYHSENFIYHFSAIFQEKELDKFLKIFKTTILINIDSEGLLFLVNLLKILTGYISESIFTEESSLIWDDFFIENFDTVLDYKNVKILKSLILRVDFIENYFPIYSPENIFIDFNIEKTSFNKIIILYEWLKEYYKKILFSDVIFLFLLMNKLELKKVEIVIIYKDIPKYLIISLKKKLEIKYNIKIIDVIHINHLKFLKRKIKTVGIFDDIDLSDYDFKILKLSF